MAELNIDGRVKVKNLCASFKRAYGATLRVYTTKACNKFADPNATLASIRADGAKGGDLKVNGNMLVGNFERKLGDLYGIGIQVANSDNTSLVSNSITIAAAGRE